ncbi:MAG: WD40 repeat domain-containing protein, partial [Formosimonas sp.]
TGHQSSVNSAHFDRTGERVVSASADTTIKIWDAQTGQCLRTLQGHTHSVTSAHFDRTGERVVSASYDKTIKIWDAQTGQCLRTLQGHTDWVTSAHFDRTGERVVSASGDATIKIWDAQTGQCLRTLYALPEMETACFDEQSHRWQFASPKAMVWAGYWAVDANGMRVAVDIEALGTVAGLLPLK